MVRGRLYREKERRDGKTTKKNRNRLYGEDS